MNEIDEILDLLNRLENIDWDLSNDKFTLKVSNLLNLLDIELTDIKISMEELKNETIKLKVALEEIESDEYINKIVEDILEEYKQDITGASIILTNEEVRVILLKELFEK